MVYVENNLVDSDGGVYLTVDSLMEIDNIIIGSNNITLRKVNVKPYGFYKMYIDKELMEDKLYQIINQFSERKIAYTKFYSILLNKIHPFYYGNGRTCKILFAKDDIIRQNIQTKFILYIKQCCLKCKKNTESKNPKISRIMLSSKCAVCDSKTSKFFKQQEASELFSSLWIKTPLSKILLIGPYLF